MTKTGIFQGLVFGAVLFAGFAACGGSTEESGGKGGSGGATGGSGGATGGSGGNLGGSGGATGGSGGTSTGGNAGSSFGGAGGLDASSDVVVLQDAGWFDCGGCACDGTTHYCVESSGGAAKLPPLPDASTCADSGTTFGGCNPLPATCPTPATCDCLTMPVPGACFCSDAGGGLLVKCMMP